MKKIIPLVCLIILILLSTRSAAQTYTLEACIDAALKNNQQLKNSQLDIAAAAFRIKEVKSALLPTVDLIGQSMYYKDLPAQYAPASAFGGPEGQYNRLSLNMKQSTSASLQATQTLFNKSVITGLRAARVTQEAAQLQERVVREDMVYNVMATYYSIQVLTDNLALLSENIANLEKTVHINEAMKESELVSANVHNRMLINLENLRNQYENQKLLLDKNVTLLKYFMDMNMEETLTVAPFDYAAAVEEASAGDLMQRPDIQLQKAQIKLAEYDKKVVAAGYYPVLTNNFYYGYTGYNNEFGPFTPINNDWVRSSYVALTLKVPVFDGFKKQSQIRQKEITLQKNNYALSSLTTAADKEVKDAMADYATNRKLTASNRKSLDLATELFETSQGEYESGITSASEFLNAQNDLTNARTNYSAALLNLKLSELTLKKANGSLLNNL